MHRPSEAMRPYRDIQGVVLPGGDAGLEEHLRSGNFRGAEISLILGVNAQHVQAASRAAAAPPASTEYANGHNRFAYEPTPCRRMYPRLEALPPPSMYSFLSRGLHETAKERLPDKSSAIHTELGFGRSNFLCLRFWPTTRKTVRFYDVLMLPLSPEHADQL